MTTTRDEAVNAGGAARRKLQARIGQDAVSTAHSEDSESSGYKQKAGDPPGIHKKLMHSLRNKRS